ncbi:MAG: ATP-binding protein [Pseudomonadota bacterium]
MDNSQFDALQAQLTRISKALETISQTGKAQKPGDWSAAHAWLWQAHNQALKPVSETGALPIDLLIGLDQQIEILHQNTKQFADGFAANNALLWGARGMGKSSLVKAIHHSVCSDTQSLHLVEIYREDINSLPLLLDLLRSEEEKRFILFCDDLSFDEQDSGYKSLKAVLEGGVEARPHNVIFYATSNRRHLIPRQMIENERSTAIHPGESVEEKVSLSDRFGLWLGFYPCNQDDYLAMVNGYADHYGLKVEDKHALEWAKTRGHRSGRIAWQYIQHVAGVQGISL